MCWLNILDRFNFRWFIFVNNTIQFQINIWEITNQSSIDVISTEIFYLQFNWCLFKKNIQRSLKISLQPVWKVKLIVEFDATQKIYFFLVRNAVFLLLRISFVFLFYHFETSLWCLLELWVEKSQSVMQFCAKKELPASIRSLKCVFPPNKHSQDRQKLIYLRRKIRNTCHKADK